MSRHKEWDFMEDEVQIEEILTVSQENSSVKNLLENKLLWKK